MKLFNNSGQEVMDLPLIVCPMNISSGQNINVWFSMNAFHFICKAAEKELVGKREMILLYCSEI